ncbi:DUF2397 domain-containing protein [Dactylosporangium sp. AC04546]|uniref:DUF2397 domain-containing protein n=1 Tax=Dactylosporangium sp. AC04546 TaxID=2862460 RepID=UPI001EE14EDC|nr:DUF2397 domain-containing protein [Dactylosporangium sp. AC04546]WVK78915.1 DUF2397 domain-containing protein [Dactylosporangium sp. AC04546]
MADANRDHAEAGRRLRLYTYLSVPEARTHFAIMRVFTSTLLADLSAGEVAASLAQLEHDGRIDVGESAIEQVVVRLKQLRKWGNLVPGRRETNARSITEFAHGSRRYQVDKLAVRVHREAEELLAIPEGAREVSRELLPAIRRGMDEIMSTIGESVLAEQRQGADAGVVVRQREQLAEQVTTLFLQHAELSDTVRDFYAHLGQVVARHDLNPDEIAGFRGLLVEYIQLVVEDVLRYTPPIAERLDQLGRVQSELLRLLAPTADLGEAVERARGRSETDWRGLADWFVDRPGQPSQVWALREATTKAISSLLSNVKRSTGGGGIAPGRRAELIRLAGRFDAATPWEAHTLFAHAFSLASARHWVILPDVDETPPSEPWWRGSKLPVPVSVSSRAEPAARGRAARIVENPLGEYAALAEAEAEARQRDAVYAELRAVADRLAEVTLSAGALDVLYDLIRRAMGHREEVDGIGEFVHSPSALRVQVGPKADARVQIRAAHGVLTLHGITVSVSLCGQTPTARGVDG